MAINRTNLKRLTIDRTERLLNRIGTFIHIMAYYDIAWKNMTHHDISWLFFRKMKTSFLSRKRAITTFLSRKRTITTFLLRKFMITHSSIAFKDFLGSIYASLPHECFKTVLSTLSILSKCLTLSTCSQILRSHNILLWYFKIFVGLSKFCSSSTVTTFVIFINNLVNKVNKVQHLKYEKCK